MLVVDDDSALIRTLADILRMHGYAPATAGTGKEGLKLAAKQPPALAIVDLRLPDMDGMELAARLHALSELTEVVVLTGNASVESAIAALREHSIDYLLKPVKVEQLLQVASVATERWQRRNAEEKLRESDERFREALEIRASQQAAVAKFGQRALAADALEDLMIDAVNLVAQTLDLAAAGIFERRSDDSLVPRVGTKVRYKGIPSQREEYGRTAISVVIAGLDPAAPYGVLAAQDGRKHEFTQDDVHFMQAIANVVGTAVQRNRTEAAFRQAQRLEAVGRLAGGVAHDFNNMLTAIIGYGEMIRMNLAADDPQRGDVEEILKAADRAAGLTRQLLAFSRQQVLQPRVVCLNDIVTDMEKMLRRLIGADIEFTTAVDKDLGFAKADPGQIEQVILNLCVNARDAIPDGGRLTVETANREFDSHHTNEHSTQGPGAYVMLAVSDNGTGMDAETRARIFEPFFTTKAPEKGTGLGLATVYGVTPAARRSATNRTASALNSALNSRRSRRSVFLFDFMRHLHPRN